jgi:hypothetical protein
MYFFLHTHMYAHNLHLHSHTCTVTRAHTHSVSLTHTLKHTHTHTLAHIASRIRSMSDVSEGSDTAHEPVMDLSEIAINSYIRRKSHKTGGCSVCVCV